MKRLRRWIRLEWACITRRCDYYSHYLAHGPADLTHIGFHSAERKCEAAQKQFTQWIDAHQHDDARIPEQLEHQAAYWERKVRA